MIPPVPQRPLLAFGADRLRPVLLELSKPFRNPMQPLFQFNPFPDPFAGGSVVWGHGAEDAQHQRFRGRTCLGFSLNPTQRR